MGKGDRRAKVRTLGPKTGWQPPPLRSARPQRPLQSRDKGGRFGELKQEDARVTALNARARHYGKEVPEDVIAAGALRKRMSTPWLEDPLGMVMERRLGPSDIARHWSAWADLASSYRTFQTRILGIRPGPQASNMPLLNDRPAEPPDAEREDLRDDEQKDRDARASWASWKGRLEALPEIDRILLMQALSGFGKALWGSAAPTTTGIRTLEALEGLVDRIEGER